MLSRFSRRDTSSRVVFASASPRTCLSLAKNLSRPSSATPRSTMVAHRRVTTDESQPPLSETTKPSERLLRR